ncbi:MAG: hypothetical protein LH468_04635 [Nocardioides sp.]|nr:hypothetical protein [Nocardioides sp.]
MPTIVLTPAELSEIAQHAASLAHQGRHNVELVQTAPTPEVVELLEADTHSGGTARVGGWAIHLLVDSDDAGAALLRKAVERQLGVTTNRNATVISELAARWGA